MRTVIVQIPACSSVEVSSHGGVLKGSRGVGGGWRVGCFLQIQRRTVKKKELHIYFLFPHVNYLCNFCSK